jgi:hypothetical protein
MTSKVRHVDIIINDPLAGAERVIASVSMNGGPKLELSMSQDAEASKSQMWSYLKARVRLDPQDDPTGFLEALPLAIDATYVVASPVHDAADCPFPKGRRIASPSVHQL